MEKHSYPPKLYELVLDSIVQTTCDAKPWAVFFESQDFICTLPPLVQVDFFEKMFKVNRSRMQLAWFHLFSFDLLIRIKTKRLFLIKCYQWLFNAGHNIHEEHLLSFKRSCMRCTLKPLPYLPFPEYQEELINLGLRMGDFLNDGGWFKYSIPFLDLTEVVLVASVHRGNSSKLLELYGLQLYATSKYCSFSKSTEIYRKLRQIIKKNKKLKLSPAFADVYCNISIYHFAHSRYERSYRWAVDALHLSSHGLSKKSVIKILRQLSKACVHRRWFHQARFLISQAIALGDSVSSLPMYSDILMDYGYCLLNSDNVELGVATYRKALKMRLKIYRSNNINIAIAAEDLAYALYVKDYSSGQFTEAEQFAEAALRHMDPILPEDHYFRSSVKRVRALILEEIALDSRPDAAKKNELLKTAEDLHNSSSAICLKHLGMNNLQTAKHFGNLGRLYQSMGQFEKAEKLQLEAIALKIELLGQDDYEVGLSVGHLASLYNYHMKKYARAEVLYFRSIAINIRLFGPRYSHLEYDYKGLIHIYEKTLNVENLILYRQKLREWEQSRNESRYSGTTGSRELTVLSANEIIFRFAEIRTQEMSREMERANLAHGYQQAYEKLADDYSDSCLSGDSD